MNSYESETKKWGSSLKCIILFMLFSISCLPVKAGKENEEKLSSWAEKMNTSLTNEFALLFGDDANVSVEVSYQKRVFEIKQRISPAPAIEKDQRALLVRMIAKYIKGLQKPENKEYVICSLLGQEQLFPGFIECLVKSKTFYKMIFVDSEGNVIETGLKPKEMVPLQALDKKEMLDRVQKNGMTFFNQVVCPININGTILKSASIVRNTLWLEMTVPDETISMLEQDTSIAKKLIYQGSYTKKRGLDFDYYKNYNLGYRLNSNKKTTHRLELIYSKEERESLEKDLLDDVDREFYQYVLMDKYKGFPQKIDKYRNKIGTEYGNKTFTYVHEIHNETAKGGYSEMTRNPNDAKSYIIEELIDEEMTFMRYRDEGVTIKRIIRGLGEKDVEIELTPKDMEYVFSQSMEFRDSIVIQNLIHHCNYMFNQINREDNHLYPLRLGFEGNNIVWSWIATSQNFYQYLKKNKQYTRAWEYFRGKGYGDVVKDAVGKLKKNYIYRIYDKNEKHHFDTIIQYGEFEESDFKH